MSENAKIKRFFVPEYFFEFQKNFFKNLKKLIKNALTKLFQSSIIQVSQDASDTIKYFIERKER